MILTTLCYIENEDSYLMLHRVKKEKDINKDKWIGVGGKFEPDESPEECLLREVKEETGLRLTSFRMRGVLTFSCCPPGAKPEKKQGEGYDLEYIFLYTADGYEGEIGECAEGTLEWVKKSEIETLNIWEGDKIFFRLLRENAPFFSLKLSYEGDELVYAALDAKRIV